MNGWDATGHVCTIDEDGYCDECGYTWPEAYQWIGLASSLDDGNWTPWRLAGSSCNGLVAS